MANALRILPVVALALSAAGCLQVETTHTLYLTPAGAVSWMVEEKGVYSDVKELAGRQAEEDGYIVAAKGGTHKMALGLAALGPDGPVRSRVLRGERPFHVVTEARYDSIERVMHQLFWPYAGVTLGSEGDEMTLRIVFDLIREAPEEDGPVGSLLEGLDDYTIVLTEGAFVSGSGFDIKGATATISKEWLEQIAKADESKLPSPLVLTWKR